MRGCCASRGEFANFSPELLGEEISLRNGGKSARLKFHTPGIVMVSTELKDG